MAIIKGVAVPFRFTVGGYPVAATDKDLLQDSIFTILSTIPGERRMRPDFGCWLIALVHENMSEAEGFRARSEVKRALRLFEPRVTVEEVTIILKKMDRLMEITVVTSLNGLELLSTTLEVGV